MFVPVDVASKFSLCKLHNVTLSIRNNAYATYAMKRFMIVTMFAFCDATCEASWRCRRCRRCRRCVRWTCTFARRYCSHACLHRISAMTRTYFDPTATGVEIGAMRSRSVVTLELIQCIRSRAAALLPSIPVKECVSALLSIPPTGRVGSRTSTVRALPSE